jgi:hypothetical protein
VIRICAGHRVGPLLILAIGTIAGSAIASAAEHGDGSTDHHQGPHRNHIAGAAGVGWHDSESALSLTIEYERRLYQKWGVIGFWEETFGDFDLGAIGVLGAYHPSENWKVFTGTGIERKLKAKKNKGLIRVGGTYGWHFGNFSVGPLMSIDFVEGGNRVYYLELTGGYGF